MKNKTVSAYITRAPKTVELEMPLSRAMRIMQQHGIRHLPVTRRGKLVGVISDRDVKLVLGMKNIDTNLRTVKWAYSPNPFKVSSSMSLLTVAKKLKRRKYGSALVVDKGKLKGIFTVVDALTALCDLLTKEK